VSTRTTLVVENGVRVRAPAGTPADLAATYGRGMFVSNGNQRATDMFTAPPARS
jgi:hypothetical protein